MPHGISTHVPVLGNDVQTCLCHPHRHISIHAPREGSDLSPTRDWSSVRVVFLSTLPVRGATSPCVHKAPQCPTFLSTLPVRGATPAGMDVRAAICQFLSTLPVRGATAARLSYSKRKVEFLSTLPVRGATLPSWHTSSFRTYFYPRSP